MEQLVREVGACGGLMAEMVERLDTDGNGTLDATELEGGFRQIGDSS